MSQITSGLRAALSLPTVYDFVQNLVGARRARLELSAHYLRPQPEDLMVDVGCGTGEMLEALPANIRYVGFDLSQRYIDSARARFGDRARFECLDVAQAGSLDIRGIDLALAFGLLHHLDDHEVRGLLCTLKGLLRPGGRVVTIDPTLTPGQHPIAAYVARRDRGRNVRAPEDYRALACSVFDDVESEVRHDLLRIPYSHCILQMRAAAH
jgi:SAM-dependent methyltransferase